MTSRSSRPSNPVSVRRTQAPTATRSPGSTSPPVPGRLLPSCPLRATTGLLCPACGGTRMVYDLVHGQFAAAWLDNRALSLAAPLALALWGRWTLEGLRGRAWRPRIGPWGRALILTVPVVWATARNTV